MTNLIARVIGVFLGAFLAWAVVLMIVEVVSVVALGEAMPIMKAPAIVLYVFFLAVVGFDALDSQEERPLTEEERKRTQSNFW